MSPSAYTVSVSLGCQRFGQHPEDTIDPRPPTLVLARLRAGLGDRDFTDSDRRPIRPPTHLFDRLP